MFKIYFTETFENKIELQNKDFKCWLNKILDQLQENPFLGKPIKFNWFREKKFGKFRVYYLVYETLKIVYFVNISQKKDQQKIIDSIILLKEFYENEIKKLSGF